jgi:leader peptidase (prepilin peptidase)/N-methyltransferase
MEEVFLILFGLVIGSFLNVVIHRLPRGQNVVWPGSHCPSCETPIRFYQNIPVFSYLALRGRCAYCRTRISIQYPLVELLTAFTFWLAYRTYGPSLHTSFVILFLCLLIALALIDLEHMILPDSLTIGGAVVFLAYSFFQPEISTLDAVLSGFVCSLVFTGLYFFYLKVRKIEGLGFGDVKMVLFLGLFLGHRKLIIAIFLASITGLLTGVYFIIFRHKNLKLALPFGTFLSLGSCLSLFAGEKILDFIQSLY